MNDPDNLIKTVLSDSILRAVEKTSRRSTIWSFKTGAVIFDNDLNIKSKGCSHISLHDMDNERSVHAENHALNNISHVIDKSDLNIIVYTLNRRGENVCSSSRPCKTCADRLKNVNINKIYYLEKDNSGEWHLNCESPHHLISRSKESN